VNQTLVFHTALQRAMSPPRALLAFSVLTFPALMLSFAPQFGAQALQSGALFAAILGAGMIGQDVSSGVLQLLFARPVARGEYVLSRWFAVGACAAILVLIQTALGTLVMTLRGFPPPLGQIGAVALEQMLSAFGIAGVLALFSSVSARHRRRAGVDHPHLLRGVLQVIAQFTRSPARGPRGG
jgi:ABC-type transport system involved in multi-copper enzyme maturation permease subunit